VKQLPSYDFKDKTQLKFSKDFKKANTLIDDEVQIYQENEEF
jgi:hypothetical protein